MDLKVLSTSFATAVLSWLAANFSVVIALFTATIGTLISVHIYFLKKKQIEAETRNAELENEKLLAELRILKRVDEI